MRNKCLWLPLTTVALLGLAACGGDDQATPSGLSCTSLAPLVAGANTDTNCVGNCTIENERAIADNNFGSAGVFRFDGTGSGSVAANVKANNGGMFAVGTRVGVIWSATAATQSGVAYQLNTYLAGVMQDSFVLGYNGNGTSERAEVHNVQTTTRAYDTVEFKFLRTAGTTTGSATVYELCSD